VSSPRRRVCQGPLSPSASPHGFARLHSNIHAGGAWYWRQARNAVFAGCLVKIGSISSRAERSLRRTGFSERKADCAHDERGSRSGCEIGVSNGDGDNLAPAALDINVGRIENRRRREASSQIVFIISNSLASMAAFKLRAALTNASSTIPVRRRTARSRLCRS
jgi:hypothetical protein